MSRIWMVIVLALLLPVGSAAAQQPPNSKGAETAAQAMPAQDREFLREIALTNELEIQEGLLARERAEGARVKDFADALVKDHAQAKESIERVAKNLGMPLPDGLTVSQREKARALVLEVGGDFEPAYLLATIESHEHAIAVLQQEIEQGQLPDMKNLAKDLLPVFNRHLGEAQKLVSGVRAKTD